MGRDASSQNGAGTSRWPVPASHRSRARDLGGFVLRLQPIVNVLAHHVFGQAIALLDLAFELVALAVDCGQIIVGELTPLLLDLALGLLPVSFDAVPVHRNLHMYGCGSITFAGAQGSGEGQ